MIGVSEKTYIENILKCFDIKNYKPINTPISKGEKFNLNQCTKNDLKIKEMTNIPYA